MVCVKQNLNWTLQSAYIADQCHRKVLGIGDPRGPFQTVGGCANPGLVPLTAIVTRMCISSHVTVVLVLHNFHTIGLKIARVPQVHLHTLKTYDYACSLPGAHTCKFPDVPRHNACKITRSSCRNCLQDDP